MFIILSHVLAFSSLFIGSIFDLRTSEVPDSVSLVAVAGGIFLHFLASLNNGFDLAGLLNYSLILNEPLIWIQSLGEPLLWSLSVGLIFSVYGWGAYYLGLWGGADAFAMSVLGFAAPTALTGFSMAYPINIFLNILLAGFVYTLGFALYKSWGTGAFRRTYDKIKENELRVSAEIITAGFLSIFVGLNGAVNSLLYFGFFVLLIILYRYLKIVQDDIMSETVKVSDLEGGEVLSRNHTEDGKVRGITQEEIENLEKDEVEIREGVRFIPVFPVALLVTDVFGGGIFLLSFLISL